MKKILVVNGLEYGSAVRGLGEPTDDIELFRAKPELFALVMFTGGADVHPSLYGDTSPDGQCQSDLTRDTQELNIFRAAVKEKIPMVGICRGSQFLNVMNGGTMMHHISNHATGRQRFHDFQTQDGNIIQVNSLHHQMSIPGPSAHIIGWCPTRKSDIYIGREDTKVEWPGPEIEALYWPKTNCAGAQYHPEMMRDTSNGYRWFHKMTEDLLVMGSYDFTQRYVRGNGKGKNEKRMNA